MYNGFELPKEILDQNLKFIREEISRMESRLAELERMKSYHLASDDAQTLRLGYMKLIGELKSLLRHDYDAENLKEE